MRTLVVAALFLVFVCNFKASFATRLSQVLQRVTFEEEIAPKDVSPEVDEDCGLNKTCLNCGPKENGCKCYCHGCYCKKEVENKMVEVDIMLSDEEPHPDCCPELNLKFHIDDKYFERDIPGEEPQPDGCPELNLHFHIGEDESFERDIPVSRRCRSKKITKTVEGKEFVFEFHTRIRRGKIRGHALLVKPKHMYIGKFDVPL